MKQKILYIAGLGHSGSTILDLSLGSHPDIIGLGEIYTLLDSERRKNHYVSYCSCGRIATDCSFWEQAESVLSRSKDVEEQYSDLLLYFQEKYGAQKVLVDSSKNSYNYLKFLNSNFELKVIYLTRDIRSWIYSRHLSTGKPLILLTLRWYLENKKLLFSLKKMGIQAFKAGYEELSLYPEFILKAISKYAGVEYDERMLDPDKSGSHIISGNILRTDPLKRSRFIYDARWLSSTRLMLLSPVLSILSGMNKRMVYHNLGYRNMKEFYLFGTKRREEFSKKYN